MLPPPCHSEMLFPVNWTPRGRESKTNFVSPHTRLPVKSEDKWHLITSTPGREHQIQITIQGMKKIWDHVTSFTSNPSQYTQLRLQSTHIYLRIMGHHESKPIHFCILYLVCFGPPTSFQITKGGLLDQPGTLGRHSNTYLQMRHKFNASLHS